jgi:DNA helicase-2/ATP-dependent DNA helicase PcrA
MSQKPIRIEDDFQQFPKEDWETAQPESLTSFVKGQRVHHPSFGAGSIFQVEGSGDQEKVSVLFADQTIKKFVVKYARLAKV